MLRYTVVDEGKCVKIPEITQTLNRLFLLRQKLFLLHKILVTHRIYDDDDRFVGSDNISRCRTWRRLHETFEVASVKYHNTGKFLYTVAVTFP